MLFRSARCNGTPTITTGAGWVYTSLYTLGIGGFKGANGPPNEYILVTAATGGTSSTLTANIPDGNIPSGTYTSGGYLTQEGWQIQTIAGLPQPVPTTAVLAYTSITSGANSTINNVKTLYGSGYIFNGVGQIMGVVRQQLPWVPASLTFTNCDFTNYNFSPGNTNGISVDSNPDGYSQLSMGGVL